MYAQDSFFDLSGWGQVGLGLLSLVLFALMVLVTWRALGRFSLALRVVGAFALFWLFVWLSPQVYYMYYRMIIPDLPLQWVVWPLREPFKPLAFLTFSYRPTLSAHGQGILGWAMILAGGLSGRVRRAPVRGSDRSGRH